MHRGSQLDVNRYSVVKHLGSGGFGDAFLVKDANDGMEYVLKCSKTVGSNDTLLSEAQNLLLTTCDHVVHCFGVWLEPMGNRCCMLLEYCDGGDLEDYLSYSFPLTESELVSIFAQLLLGLDHIHLKHLIHRDIKLQNLMLHRSTGVVKIGDFGMSKALRFTDEVSSTRLGTPLYTSPEVLKGLGYTRKTDVWSMGVAFYRLMTNRLPFPASNVEEMYESYRTTRPVHPCRVHNEYSEPLGDLVMKMLTKSRRKRPNARELLALPLFTETLSARPWHPPHLRGSNYLFSCRPMTNINIRSLPSLAAERVGEVSYGDQVLVSEEEVSSEGMMWYRVLYPLEGYCITTTDGHQLFQRVSDPARFPPISSLE
ncbi:protein kinase, putative [Trypanosoma brucei gambiense DAL972]|uniref:non-specific serine/threonine protein kinase n=1 Tax=Trypanosoma brucei gambiense (strain MHOM/CI/86/DAL972) TaxID=679716 RepID=D0A8X3_TRYB9|nr:protein kinase, putative [Trypanosoma brucei gambiense DAL972]CBH18124.1 protein kinase, putative [Trypanosoma brucei gambiense DAL972]|eukprot:XP_011780388.1 protein kinase, putative [Trypanosoma brucei gambiense DAL972]